VSSSFLMPFVEQVASNPTAYLGYAYWDKFKAIFERK
jgi:hypothetical protein